MKGKEIRIISLLVLDTIFFLIEAIVGYSVHSLALVADSFHMLNDIISLFIALWAVKVKNTKPADGMYTYGWQRAEILGALINAVFLLALCFTIVIEAVQRLISPPEISNPVLVLVVGILGLASNFLGLFLFHEHGHSHSHGGSSSAPLKHSHSHDDDDHSHSHQYGSVEEGDSRVEEHHEDDGHDHDHEHDEERSVGFELSRNQSSGDIREYMPENFIQRFDAGPVKNKKADAHKKKKSMNMEGVFLHVLGDALGNVGVIVSALIIWKTNWPGKYYSDPIISLALTVIIFSSALPLCKKSSKILLQATPTNIDSHQIIKEITKLESVKSIHDFHVWNLNEDILIASLHLKLSESFESPDFQKQKFIEIVSQVREVLHKFNIHSVTIQPEFNDDLIANEEYYGETSKLICSVDNAADCFNGKCLKH